MSTSRQMYRERVAMRATLWRRLAAEEENSNEDSGDSGGDSDVLGSRNGGKKPKLSPKGESVDPSFVSVPPQEYLCQICMKVLQQPHVTECCGQHFCKGCLDEWFEKNQQQNKVCPHCRTVGFVHILYKPLQRKINELKVYCSNRKLGCDVTLKLEELNLHVSVSNSSGCGFVSIPCPSGCGQEVFRNKMDSHMAEKCAKREVICSYCSVAMAHGLLADHYKVCEEMKVYCPRKCGGKEMRRGDLKNHEEECPDMPVKCPYFNSGCRVELTRKMLDEHVEGAASIHLMNLMTSYNTLSTQFEASRKDLKDFRSQVAVAVKTIKGAMENSVICKSLECIESSLRGNSLDSILDSISFAIPADVEIWVSPSFTVSPGYSMCARVTSKTPRTILELLLLSGNMDDQVEWPMDVKKKISLRLYMADVSKMPPKLTVPPDSLNILRCKDESGVVIGSQSYRHTKGRASCVKIVLEPVYPWD